ncbi:MAG: extracellular solute-binding protein [Actinomycetes bacterium]
MTRLTNWSVIASTAVALLLASCASADGGGSASQNPSASNVFSAPGTVDLKGETITVLLPYDVPAELLKDFTDKTGIEVKLETTGWDAVQSKLIVANTAQTYVADVAEFDWSFTGQFAGQGWVEPLETALSADLQKDLTNTSGAFSSGGHIYAACYSNDFRMSLYNSGLFLKSGLTTFPSTFEQLGVDAEKLKNAGVQYPISLPMAATEGGVTPWYLLTIAMGGQLFDDKFKPIFADPGSAGAKALAFEIEAVKKGWVSPGSVTLDDGPAFDKFVAGSNAIALASSPGNLATAYDTSGSTISGVVKPGLVPGIDGPGNSFGLPEGLSIPVTAQHKDAALAFIEWWEQPATTLALFTNAGMLPCRSSVLADLVSNGQLQGGAVISDQFQKVVPLFPQGAPIWYSKFSSEAQGLINSAIKGEISANDALTQLADKTNTLISDSA